MLACRSTERGEKLRKDLLEEGARNGKTPSLEASVLFIASSDFSANFSWICLLRIGFPHHVICPKSSALPGLQVQVLDVACLESVRRFASLWQQRPLHILVNNAGMFTMGGKL